jgi:hypothetical protein
LQVIKKMKAAGINFVMCKNFFYNKF